MATKPQLISGARLTKRSWKRRGERGVGRPVGTKKKRKFEETKLGFMIKHETSVIFDMIMASATKREVFYAPDPTLIESICLASKDKVFEKPKFYRYLDEYVLHGIYPPRAKVMTPKLTDYYKAMRIKKMREDDRKRLRQTRRKLKDIQKDLRVKRLEDYRKTSN